MIRTISTVELATPTSEYQLGKGAKSRQSTTKAITKAIQGTRSRLRSCSCGGRYL
jgi:hypothetical protein